MVLKMKFIIYIYIRFVFGEINSLCRTEKVIIVHNVFLKVIYY